MRDAGGHEEPTGGDRGDDRGSHGAPADRARGDDRGPLSPRDDEEIRAEEAFIRGLLARGEAARAVNGVLPPGALFEIVEEPPGQLPKVVRRRFSR